EKRQQSRAAQQRAAAELQQILSPEQQQQLAAAQQNAFRGRGPSIEETIERMHLTPKQQETLQKAAAELQAAQEKARPDGEVTDEEREQLRQAGERYQKVVQETLTPEQLQQLQALRRQRGGFRGPFGGLMQRAAMQLDLNPDQKQKLEELLARGRAEVDQI